MAILTRGEIADLRERSKVVNVRFSALSFGLKAES